MKQNKKKYDELQAKIFLLTEEKEKLQAANKALEVKVEVLEIDKRESLNFICKLDGPAEALAVDFLTRKLGKVCGQ
tara:strand:- start:199 stop:426 length:228 start_codon:yes stop_codon:yes gene_type:complete